ncbi:ribosomal protein L5 [Suhomyces tanzawaensis NRRL Y-17324]|uniref:Large ribosomal subunit protein uL5m n=1 Tax=Suhomyces tanzawaensis NRRL Y-17324 TaxID=984487 RepID=A0A1E4SKW5_9ASCO|nr:ribosomal protein L5 [Suhomyces tanzawaensis NRRL Y-17324]ODV80138.1 ribosomal protein L5 [Suhomyces tanzawaensis NRRL Y-17324]
MSIARQFVRQFSSTGVVGKPGYSTVEPVHHLVNIRKAALKPKYQGLLIPKDDIRSVGFKPTEIDQDRVAEYYQNTLKSDLLLHNYEHGAQVIEGEKKRSWGTDSPYKLYRNLKKAKRVGRATRDIHPIKHDNVPQLESIYIQSYNKWALEESWLNISTRLQLSQITNVKAKQIYAKANILPWRLREGKPCGAKVEIKGIDMSQFITTLTELVLPRIRTFKGIKNTSGDSNGNITFGLDPDNLKYFPEIESFQDLFPNLNGVHITFKTTARTDEQARTLLSALGLPFYDPN